jgi:hypothetical protein
MGINTSASAIFMSFILRTDNRVRWSLFKPNPYLPR